ncbi:MAG: sugar ABC transporter permease [Treponema sp.]|jgi:multiple sugar transport system permease protein|nr:sugar ABC transporter permease [Treponema sp.]
MGKKTKIDHSAYVFIAPAMIILALFLFYPMAWTLAASFQDVRPIRMRTAGFFDSVGDWTGLANYAAVIRDSMVQRALLNTLRFALCFVPASLAASVVLAVLFDRQGRGIGFSRSVFFLPYVISVVSASLIFMSLFDARRGLVNIVLDLFGIKGPNWLSSPALAMPVVALMSLWRRVGYFMLIYLAGLQNIPGELYEAGSLDGLGPVGAFWHITWPMLRKISAVVFILLLINCLNVFQEIFVMTGGGPGNTTVTISFLIYNMAFEYSRIGQAAAVSYLLFLIIIGVTLVQARLHRHSSDW